MHMSGLKIKEKIIWDVFLIALTKATAAARLMRGRNMVFCVQARQTELLPCPPAAIKAMAKYRAPMLSDATARTNPRIAIASGHII